MVPLERFCVLGLEAESVAVSLNGSVVPHGAGLNGIVITQDDSPSSLFTLCTTRALKAVYNTFIWHRMDDFMWTTGKDPQLVHQRIIDSGVFGDVHEAFHQWVHRTNKQLRNDLSGEVILRLRRTALWHSDLSSLDYRTQAYPSNRRTHGV